MTELQHYIFDGVKKSIFSWDEKIIDNIYAISFYIESFEDDPRRPSITLGYNTKEQWKKMIPEASSWIRFQG